jgi:hypothetical protein
VAAIWLLPAVIAALLANGLLYRHVKRRVEWAEAGCQRTDEAAALLAARHATSPWAAVLLGGVALALGGVVLAPRVSALYQDQLVRTRVAASLAAVRPLQALIEDAWLHRVSLPHLPDFTSAANDLGAAWRRSQREPGERPAASRSRPRTPGTAWQDDPACPGRRCATPGSMVLRSGRRPAQVSTAGMPELIAAR